MEAGFALFHLVAASPRPAEANIVEAGGHLKLHEGFRGGIEVAFCRWYAET